MVATVNGGAIAVVSGGATVGDGGNVLVGCMTTSVGEAIGEAVGSKIVVGGGGNVLVGCMTTSVGEAIGEAVGSKIVVGGRRNVLVGVRKISGGDSSPSQAARSTIKAPSSPNHLIEDKRIIFFTSKFPLSWPLPPLNHSPNRNETTVRMNGNGNLRCHIAYSLGQITF
jgi:hypothetical protein